MADLTFDTMPRLTFDTPPEIGMTIDYKGQRYVLTGATPYIREKDWEDSFTLKWSSDCLDCARPFEMTTGMAINGFNRRCDLHKKPLRAGGIANSGATNQVSALRAIARLTKEGRTNALKSVESLHKAGAPEIEGLSLNELRDALVPWHQAGVLIVASGGLGLAELRLG